MRYSDKLNEYILARIETCENNYTVADECLDKFSELTGVNQEAVRKRVSRTRIRANYKKSKQPIKRLFFDLETSYIKAKIWRPGKQYVNPDNCEGHTRIICASYKWQYEDKVHTLRWDKKQDDTKLVRDLVKIMGSADEIIGHNGDRFDMKVLRTRAIMTGNLMFPLYRTLDTLKKARQYFRFESNKLDYIGKALNVGRKMPHEGFSLWEKIVERNDKDAMERMVSYCEQDVILLEEVYQCLAPYIYHNTNFAVLKGGKKWHCPECASKDTEKCHTDTTAMGIVRRFMKCNDCNKQYKVSNRTYMRMLEHLAYGG